MCCSGRPQVAGAEHHARTHHGPTRTQRVGNHWIGVVRTVQWRAPMPWWSMRDHTDEELKAMYHYIRSLKPVGKPAPSFLSPDQVPPPPYQQLPDMSVQ
jgi:hypothetical protein